MKSSSNLNRSNGLESLTIRVANQDEIITGDFPKRDSLVLFIDNNDSRFCGWFDYMIAQNNLETIDGGTREFAFSNDEEKRDLGIYFDKFGWPKRKSDAAYRIVRKR